MRMGHLLRRAGFGANEEEMDRFLAMGEEATVEYLIEYETVDDSALEKLESVALEGRCAPARRRARWSACLRSRPELAHRNDPSGMREPPALAAMDW